MEAIEAKKADVMIDSLFNFYVFGKNNQIEPLLTYWKKGKEDYAGCIYVKSNSSIGSVKDLLGKKIASEDRFSTSSAALPITLILAENPKQEISFLNITGGNKIQAVKEAPVAVGNILFIETGDDATTEAWVNGGAVDAST